MLDDCGLRFYDCDINMNLQQIHDMAADALAGEELQFLRSNQWCAVDNSVHLFCYVHEWRIKPTIEVNGVMMSKRQAKAAWEASGATSYAYYDGTKWAPRPDMHPTWGNQQYRWQEPEWIYVNGEKIVRSGGNSVSYGFAVRNAEDSIKLAAALKNMIEIK